MQGVSHEGMPLLTRNGKDFEWYFGIFTGGIPTHSAFEVPDSALVSGISRTSTIIRTALLIAVALLVVRETSAHDRMSVVPGLLYGSASSRLADELLPDRNFSEDLVLAVQPVIATACGGAVGKTAGSFAQNGPVGVSRFLATQDDPNCNEFWGPDKWRHVAVWFGGSLGIYLFFKTVLKTSKLVSYLLSATVMSVIGVAREISDANSEKNCFSEQDLLANTVGILAAGVVIAIF